MSASSVLKYIQRYHNLRKNSHFFYISVVVYEIYMHTGRKPGAETESNVFINLIGTRGDSGNRRLHRSKNNDVKFRCGQVMKISLRISIHYQFSNLKKNGNKDRKSPSENMVPVGKNREKLSLMCILLFWSCRWDQTMYNDTISSGLFSFKR